MTDNYSAEEYFECPMCERVFIFQLTKDEKDGLRDYRSHRRLMICSAHTRDFSLV